MDTAVVLLLLAVTCSCHAAYNLTFSEDILFGASTAAYQIEGAWNASGKGESIWDRLVHTRPDCIPNNENGDVAADSYDKYKEDIAAAATIGLNHYRFSLSWPRILPNGDVSVINQAGLDYYNNLINLTIASGITPLVTLYHWDLPEKLQELGGMANSKIVDYFEDYAKVAFDNFGDRVKWWTTFNEPYQIIWGFNRRCSAPGIIAPGVGEYLAGHNLLKAHARVYHLYNNTYRSTQNGKIGITLSGSWAEAKTDSDEDVEATEIYREFTVGWFANPIFSSDGDYPSIMKERIANLSTQEGYYRSRLPTFSSSWIEYIKGTCDYFGLNHYTMVYVSAPNTTNTSGISLDNDMGRPVTSQNSSWPVQANTNFRYAPFGMRKVLNWIYEKYNASILVTENGWSDNGGTTNDTMRMRYMSNYLREFWKAIYLDNVPVIGYTWWSLLDNFSWRLGYSVKYGLYAVDYNSTNLTRTAKDSSKLYAQIIANRTIPSDYLDDE